MTWIGIEEVKHFTGIRPQHLKLDKDDVETLDDIISDWITQAQSLIISYTHNKFKEGTVPPAVQNVCLRLTSNMVALSMARRDTPITQPNEWTIQILSSEIFTQDLKDDLEEFKVVKVTGKANHISVYTISGDTLGED